MVADGIIVWANGRGPRQPGENPDDDPILIWGPGAPYPPGTHPPERGPIIVWNSRDPLGGRTKDEFEAEMRRLLAGRVEEAWIFGSYNTESFGRDSDIDVFLITQTDGRFVERALGFQDLRDLVPDMDVFVSTPQEFRKLRSEPSPGFWKSAVETMRRIV
ncbi:MAG: nucleotidyltransferase domain-containing protein [Spirochaetota bacterium]